MPHFRTLEVHSKLQWLSRNMSRSLVPRFGISSTICRHSNHLICQRLDRIANNCISHTVWWQAMESELRNREEKYFIRSFGGSHINKTASRVGWSQKRPDSKQSFTRIVHFDSLYHPHLSLTDPQLLGPENRIAWPLRFL